MSRCNYCTHKALLAHAAKTGQRVTLVPRSLGQFKGMAALLHKHAEKPDQKEHFVAWYAELPLSCRC